MILSDNMLNKKVILSAALFVSLMLISSVSAADNSTDVLNTIEDIPSEINEISAGDVLSVDEADENDDVIENTWGENLYKTFTDLNDTINGNDDSEITLMDDYVFSEGDDNFTKGILISRDLIVNGDGHTINANGHARIFNATGNVVFKNIFFINGGAKNGDEYLAISREDNPDWDALQTARDACCGGALIGGTSINCTFINNTAHLFGGAIYNGNAINSTFENNTAFYSYKARDNTTSQCWG